MNCSGSVGQHDAAKRLHPPTSRNRRFDGLILGPERPLRATRRAEMSLWHRTIVPIKGWLDETGVTAAYAAPFNGPQRKVRISKPRLRRNGWLGRFVLRRFPSFCDGLCRVSWITERLV